MRRSTKKASRRRSCQKQRRTTKIRRGRGDKGEEDVRGRRGGRCGEEDEKEDVGRKRRRKM